MVILVADSVPAHVHELYRHRVETLLNCHKRLYNNARQTHYYLLEILYHV